MSRVIKFRAFDKISKSMSPEFSLFGEFTLIGAVFAWLDHVRGLPDGTSGLTCLNDIEIIQFTGLNDKNGVEIYEGDLLNIYFTSSNGEWIHDCIYRASIGNLGDIQFEFVNLLWFDGGKNQYPSSTTLCQRYSSLDYEYKDQQIALKIPDSWQENHFHGKKWKGNDKSFYFEVIGNIYQNPELLK